MNSETTLKSQESKTHQAKVWIVVLLATTFIALTYSARNVVAAVSAGRVIDWAWQVGYEFLYWYVWAAFTPLILWLANRYDPERANWRRAAPILLAFGVLVAPAQAAVETGLVLVCELARHVPMEDISLRLQQRFPRGILVESFSNFIIYLLIVGSHYANNYYHRYRERELRSLRLEGRLAKAELQNLKMQLQPHFLFNTLNTISVLMMRDAEAANRMLVRLSELLRLSLDHVSSQEVTLRQELQFLNGYLEIEQTRFQDRLTIDKQIEPATLDAAVPNMILQPLVENAIRHGIAKRPEPGTVEIRSRVEGANLRLEIRDNGTGLATNSNSSSTGLGLANTRARLQQLYGSQHQFELGNASVGGVIVSILIPFRVVHEDRD